MAMDKLQLSLIGLGSLGLIGLFGYSKWQEIRARKHAENVFGGQHRDVLLDDGGATDSGERNEPAQRIEPMALLEPTFGGEVSPAPVVDEPSPQAAAAGVSPKVLQAAADVDREVEPAVSAAPAGVANGAPGQPPEVDEHVDCVVRFEPKAPVTGAQLFAAYSAHWPQPVAGLRWFGLPASSATWRVLTSGADATLATSFVRVVGALQLASRNGPITEPALNTFLDGAMDFACAVGSPINLPESRLVIAQAQELDRFCASVDVMIGVNVIADEQPFVGTKIRALAESAGLELGADGVYRALDDDGAELFCVGNLENTRFTRDTLRTLQTRGLTLTLDVPRAARGRMAFERMLVLARQMADALKGQLVDDNQAPLAEPALAVIREQIALFQKQMSERHLPAGSPLALRVFS